MNIAIDGLHALVMLRALRTGRVSGGLPTQRVGLLPPDPSPRKRWTRTAINLGPFENLIAYDNGHPLLTACPSKGSRIRMAGVTCAVLERGLPAKSFVPLVGGISIPCPELLFLEMDRYMGPLPQLMLGLELCGNFSRDPKEPLSGDARLHIAPATTAEKVRAYAAEAGLRGHDQSRLLAECLADNAWSPGEALVAAWAALPFTELGYGLGPIRLNERVEAEGDLSSFAAKGSRVPDILLAGTTIGINYDGEGHLDLDKIVSAASALGSSPGNSHMALELNQATEAVREKYVDDRRRDRELGAAGYTVFAATKEDLYQEGALERLMGQCLVALRSAGIEGLEPQIRTISSKAVTRLRRSMLDEVLPGRGHAGHLI